ncbi:MAG TPA: HEAT repeat domain-containing protein [Anaerolineaceae bacterium]|nr:HEAT repeat domain-containing protein [Anaerolineaceae bacterium]
MTYPSNQPIPFQHVTDALLNENEPFPAKYLHRFSDIEPSALDQLRSVWHQVNVERRVRLLEDLEISHETDTLMSFDDFARFAMHDTDARVRAGALRLLWEGQSILLIPELIELLKKDTDEAVRAAAAGVLGQFILEGELEEIPETSLRQVEDTLLALATGREPDLVRRKAIESLGYSSRREVPELIQRAFNTDDPEWLASALFAMGRSADPVWQPEVMEMLDHPDSEVQIEAVRAAGDLELVAAREPLIEMVVEGIENSDVRAAVVWSLSQIGGQNVQETLEELLENTEDDEEAEIIEQAMDNLVFTDGFDRFGMLDFDEPGTPDNKDTFEGIDLDEGEDSPGNTSKRT